jgi:uncharacterized protein YecE (DUF72 family)
MMETKERESVNFVEKDFSSDVYARDIAPELRNDAFFGKGFEDLLKQSEERDVELIVGRFYKYPHLEEVV